MDVYTSSCVHLERGDAALRDLLVSRAAASRQPDGAWKPCKQCVYAGLGAADGRVAVSPEGPHSPMLRCNGIAGVRTGG
jgi:hypothetical protein